MIVSNADIILNTVSFILSNHHVIISILKKIFNSWLCWCYSDYLAQGHLGSSFVVFVFVCACVCVWGWTSVCLCGLWWATWDLLNECYLFNILTVPTVQLLSTFKPETACYHVSHILFSLSSVSCINLVSLLIYWQFIYIIYSISGVGHLILHWHYLIRFTHLVEFLWSSTYCFCFRNWHNTWKNKKTKKKQQQGSSTITWL